MDFLRIGSVPSEAECNRTALPECRCCRLAEEIFHIPGELTLELRDGSD